MGHMKRMTPAERARQQSRHGDGKYKPYAREANKDVDLRGETPEDSEDTCLGATTRGVTLSGADVAAAGADATPPTGQSLTPVIYALIDRGEIVRV
jgi:hypothetical protein